MKPSVAPFGNDAIRLRLIEERDLAMTLSWRNRDEARIWFKSSAIISADQHRSWFAAYAEKDDDLLFIVEAGGFPVGQASVYRIDRQKGGAEVGRFLAAPEQRGKTYMGQACGELIGFCADTLGLGYLFLEVLEGNERAMRLYRRNGFVEENRCDGLIRMVRLLS